MSVALSVVVPLYNEEDNVRPLHEAVSAALVGSDYELVLVDDGSRDATYARAAELVRRDPRVRVVKFRRNYGQTAAMAAGIEAARGEIVVTMDGDLQNDPSDIPRLIQVMEDGYDLVTGWRRKRQDEGARVFVSKVANRIMARVMGVAVRDSGCSLKAYRAPLIKSMPLYGEMHRFIPALSVLGGARLAQIEVKHHPRQFGKSKYGFSRIYKVFLDIMSIRCLLSYARRPWLWHAGFTASVLALGLILMAVGVAELGTPSALITEGAGLLLVSLALFLTMWGLIGHLMSLTEPTLAQFPRLAAALRNPATTFPTKESV